jgi:hypothetical protein
VHHIDDAAVAAVTAYYGEVGVEKRRSRGDPVVGVSAVRRSALVDPTAE